MELDRSRREDCAERHARGFNCAQAVACSYADVLGVSEATLFAATEGLGLGMGGMAGTCGALSGACVVAGLLQSTGDPSNPTSKGRTYRLARQLVARFEELSGATRCRDLKGVDTGCVICSCPDCVANASQALEELAFELRPAES